MEIYKMIKLLSKIALELKNELGKGGVNCFQSKQRNENFHYILHKIIVNSEQLADELSNVMKFFKDDDFIINDNVEDLPSAVQFLKNNYTFNNE